jgi:hypothetical protein
VSIIKNSGCFATKVKQPLVLGKDGISKTLEPSYYPPPKPKAIENKKTKITQRQHSIKKPKKQDFKIIIFLLSFFTFSLSDITSR